MPVIALLIALGPVVRAGAQSMLPSGTQPARSLPAKVTSQPSHSTVEPGIVLRNVTVLRGKTSVEVHIESNGPVKPVATVLSGPERIVIDLAGVGCGGGHRLPINAGDVQDVRVALFQAGPPVTRVVVDLAHPHDYRLLSAGSTVVLAIDTGPKPAIAAPPAPAKVATVAMPSSAPPADVTPAPPAAEATADHPVSTPTPEAKEPPPAATATEAPPQPPAAPALTPPALPPEPKVSTEQPPVAIIDVPSASAQVSAAEEHEETTPHQAAKAKRPGLVRKITVSRGKEAIEVHIEANKPLRATASTLSDPERIVIDLADVRLRHPRRIPVNLADVQAVDIALYLVNPLVTRVVVNLAHAHPYHLQADGNSLTVRIATDAVKTAGAPTVR